MSRITECLGSVAPLSMFHVGFQKELVLFLNFFVDRNTEIFHCCANEGGNTVPLLQNLAKTRTDEQRGARDKRSRVIS